MTHHTDALLHARDLQAEGAHSRLARLATCCRPSALRRGAVAAVAAFRSWLRHGQLHTEQACRPWPV